MKHYSGLKSTYWAHGAGICFFTYNMSADRQPVGVNMICYQAHLTFFVFFYNKSV